MPSVWNVSIQKILEKNKGMNYNYKIYRIVNNIDDKIYIGSTRQTLRKRMEGHRSEVQKNNQKVLSQHMKGNGIENFNIELIKEMYCSSRTARLHEQIEIWKYDKDKLLNDIIAYSHSHYYTKNRDKLLTKKKRYYGRKKLDLEWVERERERGRLRQRAIRQKRIEQGTKYTICKCGHMVRTEYQNTSTHKNSQKHKEGIRNRLTD